MDLNALSDVRTIGITAGASTPNWVIRQVYLTLETMVFRSKSGWHKALYTLMRAALLSNIYVSLGAAGLCYAVSRLQGVASFTAFVLIAFLYVQTSTASWSRPRGCTPGCGCAGGEEACCPERGWAS